MKNLSLLIGALMVSACTPVYYQPTPVVYVPQPAVVYVAPAPVIVGPPVLLVHPCCYTNHYYYRGR